MAHAESTMAVYAWRYGLPLVVAAVGFSLTWRYAYKQIYAYLLNRMIPGYNKLVRREKEKLFSELEGLSQQLKRPLQLLEIGAGGGANFKFYPEGTNVIAVDPNDQFELYLKSNSDKYPHISLSRSVCGKAENMRDIQSNSVDAVVTTLVLCSVEDLDKVLSEILRILKPGGKFLYLEHVREENAALLRWFQTLINPIWKVIADGCHVTRETWKNVEQAGFTHVRQEKFRPHKIKLFMSIIRPHLMGVATK